MDKKESERRLVENEVMFRKANRKVEKGLAELEEVAEEEHQKDWLPDTNEPIDFFCECSDENCRKRILLTPSEYRDIHQNESQFAVLPGHHVPEVERILKAEDNYLVVEKFMTPPTYVQKLRKTDIDNTEKSSL